LERKIPLRRVVGKVKASEIHRVVESENPDIEKGDKAYPGLFQKSLTRYMEGMEKSEEEELQKIRKEWQDSGPPVDVQLK
jgi:signal recognition particle subunit SEC65